MICNTYNYDFDQKMDQKDKASSESKDNSSVYREVLPLRFTSNTDFIGKENIVEIALRSEKYNKLQLWSLIKTWYSNIENIKSKVSFEEVMMLKVLVAYDSFDYFIDILNDICNKNSISRWRGIDWQNKTQHRVWQFSRYNLRNFRICSWNW